MLLWTLGYMYLFSLEFYSFLNICPRVRLLDQILALFLVFWGNSILFSTVAVPIYTPTNSVGGFPFPTACLAFIIYRLSKDGPSDQREVVPHCIINCWDESIPIAFLPWVKTPALVLPSLPFQTTLSAPPRLSEPPCYHIAHKGASCSHFGPALCPAL